jgi:predicted nucleic acid-binding protein
MNVFRVLCVFCAFCASNLDVSSAAWAPSMSTTWSHYKNRAAEAYASVVDAIGTNMEAASETCANNDMCTDVLSAAENAYATLAESAAAAVVAGTFDQMKRTVQENKDAAMSTLNRLIESGMLQYKCMKQSQSQGVTCKPVSPEEGKVLDLTAYEAAKKAHKLARYQLSLAQSLAEARPTELADITEDFLKSERRYKITLTFTSTAISEATEALHAAYLACRCTPMIEDARMLVDTSIEIHKET